MNGFTPFGRFCLVNHVCNDSGHVVESGNESKIKKGQTVSYNLEDVDRITLGGVKFLLVEDISLKVIK